MNIVFDADTHSYFLDGKQMPSVTQVIKSAGMMPPYSDMKAMEYGKLVHEAVADIIAGNTPQIDCFVKIAVDGFLKWRKDYKPQIFMSEKPGASETHRYAGTSDIGAVIGKDSWLIDVKTGDPSPWHIIQLAAYNELFKDKVGKPFNKFAGLYLSATSPGEYHFKPYSMADIRTGFSVFLNALNIHRWKGNHNVK